MSSLNLGLGSVNQPPLLLAEAAIVCHLIPSLAHLCRGGMALAELKVVCLSGSGVAR